MSIANENLFRTGSGGSRSIRKNEERDHLLMEQLTKALDFKLLGEQKLGPYKVYVLKATPTPRV